MYLLYLIITVLIVAGALIRKSMSRSTLEIIHPAREAKGSAKLLYLRSFKLDGKGWVTTNTDIFEGLNLFPPELDLAKAFIKFDFHLIAVGRPGEKIPEIGFDRKYFNNDVWQQEVIKLISESVLIIYRPDPSDAVLWEFEQVLNAKASDKLMIWANMGYNTDIKLNKVRYNIFKKKAFERLQEELPEFNKFKGWIALDAQGCWKSFSGLGMKQIPAYIKATAGRKI